MKMLPWIRFEVVTVMTMKDTVFWDVMLCSLVIFYQGFGVTHCLFCPDDGQSRLL